MPRSLIPNSTQVPDIILDEWMPLISGAELAVILFIARKTYGWGKKYDRISLTQMTEGTGLSRRAVQLACDALAGVGILTRRASGDGVTATAYRLELEAHEGIQEALIARQEAVAGGAKNAPVQKLPQVQKLPKGGAKNAPVGVQKMHPQETLLETLGETKEKEEHSLPPSPAISANAHKKTRPDKPALVHVLHNPPSQEEVEALLVKRKQDTGLATLFLAHYGANGWMQNGGKKVYSWPHALSGWVERQGQFDKSPPGNSPPSGQGQVRVQAMPSRWLRDPVTGEKTGRNPDYQESAA